MKTPGDLRQFAEQGPEQEGDFADRHGTPTLQFQMTFTRVALLALGMLAVHETARAKENTVIIENDEGGEVHAYYMRNLNHISNGTRVIIRGDCYSACTAFLNNPRVCVHPKARLHFHAASDLRTGELNPHATHWLILHYPPGIQRWIKAKGGLKLDGWLILSGKELKRVAPVCD